MPFFFENVFECTSRILYKKIIKSKDEYFSHKRMLKFSGPINVIVFEKRLINLSITQSRSFIFSYFCVIAWCCCFLFVKLIFFSCKVYGLRSHRKLKENTLAKALHKSLQSQKRLCGSFDGHGMFKYLMTQKMHNFQYIIIKILLL